MATVPLLTGPPLYRYIPGVGKVSAAVNGPTGPAGPQGIPGTATLNSANQTVRATTTSEKIDLTDVLVVKLVTTGSIGQTPIFASIATY